MLLFSSNVPRRLPKTLSISLFFNHFSSKSSNSSIIQDPLILTITGQFSNFTTLLQLRQFHAHIIKTQFVEFHINSIYWNSIIRSYTRLNSPFDAFKVYLAMSRSGVRPDKYTIPITLKAVCQICSIRNAIQFHVVSIRNGVDGDEFVESGLISMYTKGDDFESACKVFDEMSQRKKVGPWNAMIGGLSQGGRAKDAIYMFMRMMRNGVEFDDVTMVSVISACGKLGDLNLGVQLHKFLIQLYRSEEKEQILMLNALIDVYGKCGRMDLASRVFSGMNKPNVSSWTSMISGYGMHGHVKEALACFLDMIKANVAPNRVTFLAVLTTCVHGGLVNEGKHYFDTMKHIYGIEPELKHYGCMIDLLGKAGLLDEAKKLVEKMPMRPSVAIWGSLLGACEKHGDVEMGDWVAQHMLEIAPWNDAVFVVVSNMYASKNMWEDVRRVREVMKQRKLAKVAGYSLS